MLDLSIVSNSASSSTIDRGVSLDAKAFAIVILLAVGLMP